MIKEKNSKRTISNDMNKDSLQLSYQAGIIK